MKIIYVYYFVDLTRKSKYFKIGLQMNLNVVLSNHMQIYLRIFLF